MPKNLIGDSLDAIQKLTEEKTGEVVTPEKIEVKKEVHAPKKEEQSHIEKKEEPKPQVSSDETLQFTDELFFKTASEKLDREVKSLDDFFVEKEVEKVVEKEREYLSDFTKNYEKYFRETNGTPQDFLNLNRDLSSLTQEDVVKEILTKNNPSLSKKEIDFMFSDTYGIDDSVDDEIDKQRKEIKFKSDYDKSIREMEADKQKYLIPSEDSIASREAKQLQQAKEMEEGSRLWAEIVNETNKSLTSIEIDTGDDIKFTHTVDPNISKQVKEIASDNTMAKWMAQYSDKDGKMDTKRIQQDLYFLKNKETLLKEAREQGAALQTDVISKTDKNIDFKGGTKVSPKKVLSKEAEVSQDLINAVFKNRKKY